jgi:hypothetical protein
MLFMKCTCGHQEVPVRDTGKSGVGVARCPSCKRTFDYSCWKIKEKEGLTMHMLEAFPREPK